MADGPAREEVEAFLGGYHGGRVEGLELLSGGFWSAAYGYRVDGRELVLRLGQMREGFEMDRAAMTYDAPGLPVPEVLDIGDAFGGSYAISVRHRGRFLEDVGPEEVDVAGPTLVGLLDALKSAPPDPGFDGSWHAWLLEAMRDDPARTVSGWRAKFPPEVEDLFESCDARIRDLLGACPERRDLVHGDLLHANVLLAPDASKVEAVFSWKCSTRGDFLYDVAWCTFWGAWHPGIAAIDAFARMTASAHADAALRHHAYELHIGARHLGWCAWNDDEDELRRVADHTAATLDRGPREDGSGS